MFVEATRDLFVSRVEAQGEVCGQHGWRMTLGWIVRVRHFARACAIPRCPLVSAGRTLGELPFVAEQIFKEVVTPFGWRLGPNDFEAAADGVATLAGAEFALPAEPLLLNHGCFWLRANECGLAGAVGFAKGVPAGNQRDRFFVVHGHAAECFANIPSRGDRIRLAVWPFRIHVDQTHLHGSEWILKITLAAVAFVGEPLPFRAPEDVLFDFPYVGAPAAKSKCLEAHGLKSDVARENHEVSPGDLAAVFLLDRPEQAACLVEVHIVRPAIERSEALLARPRPPAA